jgi:hypothetical protein
MITGRRLEPLEHHNWSIGFAVGALIRDIQSGAIPVGHNFVSAFLVRDASVALVPVDLLPRVSVQAEAEERANAKNFDPSAP